jgi:RNA polymerase sigma-70 factor (ECF subfamily)
MTTWTKNWWFPGRAAVPYASKAAFSELYEDTHLSVYRYVYGLLGGTAQDAEDITAQTYLKAWDHRKQFRGTPEQAKGWLFTIAKRIVIDRYRVPVQVVAERGING